MNILNTLALTCLLVTGTTAVYWPCDTHADCTAKYSSCSSNSGSCICTDFDIVFSSDFSTCLKTSLIGDACEEDVQCNLMPTGAKCKSGVCDCADGETYVRGRCRPLNGLNQHCDTDFDCYFGYDRESVQCKDNVCTCANGYYNRHGNICRRKSMEIGDACIVDTDCDDLGANVKCRSLKCQYVDEIKSNVKNNNNNNNNNNIINTRTKRQTSTPTETNSNLSKSSPTESDDLNVTKLVNGLSTTSLKTNSNTYNNNNNNALSDTEAEDLNTASKDEILSAATNKETDKKQSREIAVQTSIDAYELKVFAPQVRNVATITTTASTSTSSRRPTKQKRRTRGGFRFNDDEKTISTVSNTDDDIERQQQTLQYGFECPYNGEACTGLPHSICSRNVCLCRQGYYHNNGKCFAELGEIAESSDECENQYDPVTKKCSCQKNFFYDYNLRGCRKPIQYHLSCTADNQCSPFGAAYCQPQIPRRCTCKQYAEYDELLQMCAYKTGLGSECETDDGCPVEHAMCSERVCVCKENFIRKDEKCLPGIGAECLENDDCHAENSMCATTTASNSTQEQSKTCHCRKGFVHFKDECLKEAENIEEECVDNEQCKPLLASCVENKCSCGEKQNFQNGRCETRKGLNEACSTASECHVEKGAENVECRNSVCQCKLGYRSDAEHRYCVASNKKNSSGRPSALKIITFMLIGSAFLITSAAIKQAYY